MQATFVFLIIGVMLLVYSYVGGLFKTPTTISPETTTTQSALSQGTTAKTGTSLKLQTQQPSVLVDTQITSGPENGEVISNTNEVIFEFKGMVSPATLQPEISFDTKVEGIDTNWVNTAQNKRTIIFPAANKQYTFQVRAKVRTIVDTTPDKRTFKISISPYFGKIKISGISQSAVTLSSKLPEKEKINITNWRVKGLRGEIIIPQGIEFYVSSNPSSQSDIFIKQYDTIYLLNQKSPLGININFRPNKCFGYLRDYYTSNFPFSYSKICPSINCEEIRYFSEACQNVIRQLQNCYRLNYSNYPQISSDSSCQTYIDNYTAKYLNYDGCIQNYSRDKDFYQNAWYIYPGYSIFCKCSDTLYLYDQQGLLVDKYFYQSQ